MANIIKVGNKFDTKSFIAKMNRIDKALKKNNDNLDKFINKIIKQNEVLKNIQTTLSNTNKAADQSGKNNKKLTEIEKELQRIRRASKKVNTETAKAQLELTQKRREARKEAEKQLGVTKQQIPFTQKMAGAFRTAAIQIAAVYAAIQGIIKGVTAYLKLSKEVNKQTSQTAATFDLAGREARELTTEIRKTSTAFDKEFNDVLKSANIISKEFGISGKEALDLINEGFEKGADINEEYLQLLKEYPSQLKTVGLNASETIAIITQTERAGVFSDKGIDAIKEAGIRLREMTPATEKALDAIGISARETQKALRDGSKSLFDVTQEVSKKLAELPPQSKEVGTAIADIFGGAGEDAGLRFLTTIGDINLNLAEIESTLSKDEQASIRLRKVWEELRTSSVGTGGFIAAVKNGLADLLTSILNFRKNFVGSWNEIIIKSEIFRTGISAIGNAVKLNFRLMGNSIMLALEPFILLGSAVKALLTQDWESLRTTIPDSFNRLKKRVNNMSDAVVEAGTNIKESFTGENLGKFLIQIEGVETKVKSFSSEYKKLNNELIEAGREQIDLNLMEIKTIEEVNGEKIEAAEEYIKAREKLEERLTQKVEDEEEKRKISAEEALSAVGDLTSGTFDLLTSLRDRDLQRLEEQEAYKLELAGDNEAAKEKIQLEYDKKRAQILRKQAIADKANALFQAAINTAVSITAVAPVVPLMILMGVLGAIQVAAIAAKPIPKFKEGTKGLPRDMLAEFGEAGAEIVKEPGLPPYIAEKRTIDYLPKGTEIIPNYETEKILQGQGGVTEQQFERLINKVGNKKPEIINYSTSITEDGFKRQVERANVKIKLMNKYMGR